MLLQVEEATQLADSTPQNSGASKGPPQPEVAESTPKHNVDNQDSSQQDPITTTSASTSESTVKGSGHHKVSPSNQPSRSDASLQLEELLKEKVGFPLRSQGHSSSAKPEDSNKLSPSENLSATVSHSGSGGSVQNVLFATRERRMKKSSSNWSEKQASGGRSKSGSAHVHLCM